MPTLATVQRRGRTARARLRARRWGLSSQVAIGKGVLIGRQCRLILEPGGRVALGDGCEIDDGTTLASYRGATLSLAPGCFVGHHCTIAAQDNVTLGDRTYLAELVSIRDHDHDPDAPPASGRTLVDPVTIGRDVWIGSKVTVLRGAILGDACVVGANAVVRGNIPPGVVAVGIPAQVTRAVARPENTE